MAKPKEQLKRSFGFWSSLSLVIGTVIGTGIFFKQGRILEDTQSTSTGVLVWVVAGLVTLAAALTTAEIAGRITQTGGLYTYLNQTYGKLMGFLGGWMQVIFYGPALIASVSFFFAALFTKFFGIGSKYNVLVALITIALIAGMNMFQNTVSERFAVTTTSVKLIPIAALILYGLFFGKYDALGQVGAMAGHTGPGGGFGAALLPALFAYDGWIVALTISGEVKNPGRTLPRALSFGILFVVFVYVFISVGIMKALPIDDIIKYGEDAPYNVVIGAFGQLGGKLLNITILISILGTINSKVLTFPRIVYEMSRENNFLFSGYFSKISPRTQTPNRATVFVAVVAAILMFLAGAQDLSDWSVLVMWLFYILTFLAVFILRRREGRPTNYKVPLYPVIPIIAILGTIYIEYATFAQAIDLAVNGNSSVLFGIVFSLLLVVAGIPLFYFIQRRKLKSK